MPATMDLPFWGIPTSSQIYNNQILNSTIKNFYFYGLYAGGNDGLVVKGCTFSRPTRSSVSSYYGFYCTTGNYNTMVDGNRFTQPFGGVPTSASTAYAIYNLADATAAKPNIFQNNMFYDWVSKGTQYAIYGTGANYSKYYHNTVAFDEVTTACACDTRAFNQTSNGVGVEFRNNIFRPYEEWNQW